METRPFFSALTRGLVSALGAASLALAILAFLTLAYTFVILVNG